MATRHAGNGADTPPKTEGTRFWPAPTFRRPISRPRAAAYQPNPGTARDWTASRPHRPAHIGRTITTAETPPLTLSDPALRTHAGERSSAATGHIRRLRTRLPDG